MAIKRLEKTAFKGIGLASQIIPNTSDNVQVQARYVQVTPETSDLNSILGMSGITGSASGGCANNLYEVLAGVVPYTGATKNVSLGSNYHITSKGFYLSTANKYTNFGKLIGSSGDDTNIQILINNREAYGVNTSYNCIGLADIFNKVPLNFPGSQGSSLFACLVSLKSKIDNITNPLRFRGVIVEGKNLPTSGVSVGDVWHLNIDQKPATVQYYAGDDVVCIGVSSSGTPTWELLGANITRIEPGDITEKNLESWTSGS